MSLELENTLDHPDFPDNMSLTEAVENAAACANFMQKFKMKWWGKDDRPHLPESVLDEMAIVAFGLLPDDKKAPYKQKSNEKLSEFVLYCQKHPSQRFWQALRNWSGFDAIYTYSEKMTDAPRVEKAKQILSGLEDTFYWE